MKWTGHSIHTRKKIDNLVNTHGRNLCDMVQVYAWKPIANLQETVDVHPFTTENYGGRSL